MALRQCTIEEFFSQTKVIPRCPTKVAGNVQMKESVQSVKRSLTQPESEYTSEIFNYLRSMENKFLVDEGFLEGHLISSKVRTILVNWLVEIHAKFDSHLKTLHLCISTVDRYLQRVRDVGSDTIQLVGITALQVATKYEESDIIQLADLVYVCDNSFTEDQLLKMERSILRILDFSFGRPSPVQFLMGFYNIALIRAECRSLGKFLLELALLDSDMSHILPSIQAAATFCLSVGILDDVMDLSRLWTTNLIQYSGYIFSDFEKEVVIFAKILAKSNAIKSHKTIRRKYARISSNPVLTGPIVMGLVSKVLK